MISTSVQSFRDPWEHEAFFRGANMKILVTTTGVYGSAVTKIDLDRLWMQRSETSLPQVAHVAQMNSRCVIGFTADLQNPPPYRNGDELLPNAMLVSSIMSDHHFRMPGALQRASMSLSLGDLAAASYALTGRELGPPAVTRHVTISDHSMGRLRSLHDAACHLAAKTPDILAHPEVAKAVEDGLIRAMVGCLDEAARAERKGRSHLRLPVMQRFERVVGEAGNQPLYLTEICAKVGVRERTLRNHCIEYLGMSPHRYLWLRRMTLVRRALSLADPTESTVTGIIADHGFWELGRFSVAYRKLFGEAPSATLRNSPEHVQIASRSSAPASRLPDPLQ
jgi:AraC-like DNA-binding protein